MRQIQIQRRSADRLEKQVRRYLDTNVCYMHALEGNRGVLATHGQLCKQHFYASTGKGRKH